MEASSVNKCLLYRHSDLEEEAELFIQVPFIRQLRVTSKQTEILSQRASNVS